MIWVDILERTRVIERLLFELRAKHATFLTRVERGMIDRAAAELGELEHRAAKMAELEAMDGPRR